MTPFEDNYSRFWCRVLTKDYILYVFTIDRQAVVFKYATITLVQDFFLRDNKWKNIFDVFNKIQKMFIPKSVYDLAMRYPHRILKFDRE
jgi:hypothetical protein